jgi:hypothetical protein
VRDDDHGPVLLGGDVAEETGDVVADLRVEVGGGLVGENDGWLVGEGAGDATRCFSPPESFSGRNVGGKRSFWMCSIR